MCTNHFSTENKKISVYYDLVHCDWLSTFSTNRWNYWCIFFLFDLKKIIFLEKIVIYIYYFGLKLYCNKKYYVHHNSICQHAHSKLPEVRNRQILLNVLYQESQINLIPPSIAIISCFVYLMTLHKITCMINKVGVINASKGLKW